MRQVYIDESVNEEASLATLIAIEFESDSIKQITRDFYSIIKLIVDKFPKRNNGSRIIHQTPVLHGRKFLVNSKDNDRLDFSVIDDEFRLAILQHIVDLVNKNNLKIVRVGYSNYNEIKEKFKDDKMYGLNWLALSSYFNEKEGNDEYIFIMDGTNTQMIDKLSHFIRESKSLLYLYDMKDSLIIPNVDRFLNNVFYVPQKFCEPLQIVDIVSYLLQKIDFVRITEKTSSFSEKLIKIANNIREELIVNSIVKMNMH